MRSLRLWLLCFLLVGCAEVWAQSSSSSSASDSQAQDSQPRDSQSQNSQPNSSQSQGAQAPASQAPNSSTSATKPGQQLPDLSPPRSDRVSVRDLGTSLGLSSSKDTQDDLDAPENDARAHPHSSDAVADEAVKTGSDAVGEFHPWNPHKAAKDIEVGNYYFNRKNYRAAEDRYREALVYKDNDAEATFRLALCLEKLDRPVEALDSYNSYLKILPNGPHAKAAHEAIEDLKASAKDRAAKNDAMKNAAAK